MHRKVGNKYQTINLYGRLLVEARPCWLHVLGYLLLSMAATPLALLLPLPLKIAVDSVIGTRSAPAAVEWVLPAARTRPDISLLTLCAVLVVVFALLAELQKFSTAMLKTYVGERLVMGFRSRARWRRAFARWRCETASFPDRRTSRRSTRTVRI